MDLNKKKINSSVSVVVLFITFFFVFDLNFIDFLDLKSQFINFFPYNFVKCPCSFFFTKALEYPFAKFFLLLFYLLFFLLLILLLFLPFIIFKKLFRKFVNLSVNFRFRLIFFIILVYETIIFIMYFASEIFENNKLLLFILVFILPLIFLLFYKIYSSWVIKKK